MKNSNNNKIFLYYILIIELAIKMKKKQNFFTTQFVKLS